MRRSDLSQRLKTRDKEQEMFVLVLNEAGMWVSEWYAKLPGFIHRDFIKEIPTSLNNQVTGRWSKRTWIP